MILNTGTRSQGILQGVGLAWALGEDGLCPHTKQPSCLSFPTMALGAFGAHRQYSSTRQGFIQTMAGFEIQPAVACIAKAGTGSDQGTSYWQPGSYTQGRTCAERRAAAVLTPRLFRFQGDSPAFPSTVLTMTRIRTRRFCVTYNTREVRDPSRGDCGRPKCDGTGSG
jgi:hypothetical protein